MRQRSYLHRIKSMRIKSEPLRHFDERPDGAVIDVLVIHSMYARGEKDELDPLTCIKCLDKHRVSAHYIISLTGQVWRLVDEERRAWHAGLSRMPDPCDNRENVNHFSIGVELLQKENRGFTAAQYQALTALTRALLRRWPLKRVLGHEHIAPGRKTDPGGCFDWVGYEAAVKRRNPGAQSVKFGPPAK